MTINAGRYSIELKELSWWDKEEIKAITASAVRVKDGEKMIGLDADGYIASKVKKYEKSITSIKEGEKEIPFTKEWLQQLKKEEGSALDEAVENMEKKN